LVCAIVVIIDDLNSALELRIERERGVVALAGNDEGLGVLNHVGELDAGLHDVEDWGSTRSVVFLTRQRHNL
jgi:hypothetical protein